MMRIATRWRGVSHNMTEAEQLFVDYWSLVIDQLGGSPSYDDLAELTHETQVALFGWCSCEDSWQAYDDCPL